MIAFPLSLSVDYLRVMSTETQWCLQQGGVDKDTNWMVAFGRVRLAHGPRIGRDRGTGTERKEGRENRKQKESKERKKRKERKEKRECSHPSQSMRTFDWEPLFDPMDRFYKKRSSEQLFA